MRVLGISAFYHDSAAALVEDGASLPPRRKSASRARSTTPVSPARRSSIASSEAGVTLERRRLCRLLRQAVPEVRAAAGDLSGASRRAASARFAWRCRCGCARSCFRKRCCAANCKNARSGFRLAEALAVLRASSEPRGLRVLSVAVRGGGGADAGRRRRMGHDLGGDRRRQEPSICCKEIHFPHSLGLLYSAFTYYTGFKVNSGEYKVMGLAPYGEPRFADVIRDNLIDLKADGIVPARTCDYFDYCTGLTMTNARFDALFGGPPRDPRIVAEQQHMDLAASVQAVMEEVGAAPDRARWRARRGIEESLPGRRRGAELRGQRQDPARRLVRQHLDSARGRRRRRRARRGAGRLSHATRASRAQYPTACDGMAGAYLGPAVQPGRDRKPADRSRRAVHQSRRGRPC